MIRSTAICAFVLLALVAGSPGARADIAVPGQPRRSNGPVPRDLPPPKIREENARADGSAGSKREGADEVVPTESEVKEATRAGVAVTIGVAVLAGGLLLLFVLRPRASAQRQPG